METVNKPSTLKPVGKVSVADKETSLPKLKPTGQESHQRNVTACSSGSSERVFTSSYQQITHVYTTPSSSSTSSSTPQVGK